MQELKKLGENSELFLSKEIFSKRQMYMIWRETRRNNTPFNATGTWAEWVRGSFIENPHLSSAADISHSPLSSQWQAEFRKIRAESANTHIL